MKMRALLQLTLLSAIAIGIHAQVLTVTPSGNSSPSVTHGESGETGTLLRKQLRWNSSIPLDKTYEQMSAEQKAAFHALYEAMPAGDEPPFPAEGMKPVFSAIKKAQNVLHARGELNMTVTVGPDGKAIKVDDFGNVNKSEMTQFAGSVLLMTKFKPAVCGGRPCTMQFPFNLRLTGG